LKKSVVGNFYELFNVRIGSIWDAS